MPRAREGPARPLPASPSCHPTAFDGILIPPGGKFPLDILYQAYKNALEQLTWARFILSDPIPPGGTTGGFSGGATGGIVSSVRTVAAGRSVSAATSSVLFAGGYLSASSFNANDQAVLYEPATGGTTPIQMTAARIITP